MRGSSVDVDNTRAGCYGVPMTGRKAINWMRGFPVGTEFSFVMKKTNEIFVGTVKAYHLKGNTVPIGVVLNMKGRFGKQISKRIAMDKCQSTIKQIKTKYGLFDFENESPEPGTLSVVRSILASLPALAPLSFTSSVDSPFKGIYLLHKFDESTGEVNLLKERKVVKTTLKEIASHFQPIGFVMHFGSIHGNTKPGNGEHHV